MKTQLEKPCDICGDLGYSELIITCTNCGIARQHVYCMRVCRHEVPEVWICEDCIPEEGTFGRNENFKDSCITVRHDVAIGGGSAKVYGDSGWHRARHCKRLKPVETGKVKFLSTEEVIKLSSGAAKTAFSSKANLGYRPNSSSAVSPVKLKPNPRIISSGLMKPPGFGRIQVDSSTSQQAPIISKEKKPIANPVKEHDCKAASSSLKEKFCLEQKMTSIRPDEEVKTSKANLLAKVVKNCYSNGAVKEVNTCNANAQEDANKQLGSDSCPVAEFKTTDELRSPSTKILLPNLRSYFPSLCATWKGGFKFFDTTAPGKYYGGFQAQPPCIVNRKAYDFSQTMPIVLQVELLPQHRVWEDLFQNDYPDFRDIALYFLPSAIIQRSKDNCASLFKLMEIRNSVMRSCINDVELIIFTSNLLHGDLQSVIERSSAEHFLLGVFRHVKSDTIPLQHHFASKECSETVDMEIDMEGGQALGRVDVVVAKEPHHLQSSAVKLSDAADKAGDNSPGFRRHVEP
uniref:AIPP2-like SPOC-like domain-containing protein n=1 Tax=Manihot esculenta TaxID=3983 RepID=A0A251L3V6_MANES